MKKVQIKFHSTDSVLDVRQTTNAIERMVGLYTTKSLGENSALWILPCKQIQTWFMRYPIDAIFVDKNKKVIAVEELKPWKMSKIYMKASGVIEAPVGWAQKNNVTVNSSFEVLPC